MNVGGAALEGGEDGGVNETDDGADVFSLAGEFLNGDILVGVFVAGEDVEGEAFAGLVEDTLRLLGFLEQIGNLARAATRAWIGRLRRPAISSRTMEGAKGR